MVQHESSTSQNSSNDQGSEVQQRIRRINELVKKLDETLTGVPRMDSIVDTTFGKTSDSSTAPGVERHGTKTEAVDCPGLMSNLENAKEMVTASGEWEEGELRFFEEELKSLLVSANNKAQDIVNLLDQLRREVNELRQQLREKD